MDSKQNILIEQLVGWLKRSVPTNEAQIMVGTSLCSFAHPTILDSVYVVKLK